MASDDEAIISTYYPEGDDIFVDYHRETDVLRDGEFPRPLTLKVDGSEPRDFLQLEMTCLSYVNLATTLFVLAAAVALDIKFPSHAKNPWQGWLQKFPTIFLLIVSFTLILLSIFILGVSGAHYMLTAEKYAQHRIRIRSWIYTFRLASMAIVIFILMAINVSLIVDSRLHSK